jgi:hypothetical protein
MVYRDSRAMVAQSATVQSMGRWQSIQKRENATSSHPFWPPPQEKQSRTKEKRKKNEGGKMRQKAMILDVSLTKALSCKLHTPVP